MIELCVSQNQLSPASEAFGLHSALLRDCRTPGREDLKGATMTKEQIRFWKNVEIKSDAECWNWIGRSKFSLGRGSFWLNGKSRVASRVALLISGIPVAPHLLVCHHCDNPRCCNPKHLFVGTQSDNMLDCYRKGRLNPRSIAAFLKHRIQPDVRIDVRGEKHGSAKLTEAQAIYIKGRTFLRGEIRKLAAQFGVSDTTIGDIKNGKKWKHLNTAKYKLE